MAGAQVNGWRRRSARGFTLVELMTVVVVIAILAAIALPAYTEYIRKSRRAEAVRLIGFLAQQQEQHRANNTTYATTLAALFPSASAPAPTSGYYTLSINAASTNATGYAVTATASGAQSSDTKCASMTLWMFQGGASYVSSPAANANQCWSR